MTKAAAQDMIPNVGDVVVKRPRASQGISAPQSCKVVYVNREHLWYEVQFRSGQKQCVFALGPQD